MNQKNNKNHQGLSQGIKSFLGALIWIGFALSLFYIPLLVEVEMYFSWAGPKGLYFMAFVQLAFFSWLILAFHDSQYRPKKNIILTLFSVFMILAGLSTILGVDPSRSFWSNHERMTGFVFWIHLFAFFLVSFSFFKKKTDWIKLFFISCASASLVAVISILDVANIIEILSRQHGSTFGNTSFMGTYLLLNVFLTIYLFLKTKGGLRLISAIFFILIFLGLLTNAGGRAALGSFAIGLVLLLFLYFFFNKEGIIKKGSALILVLMLIVGLAGVFINLFPFTNFSQTILEQTGLGTIGGRTTVGQKAWEGIIERPLLGWGTENFNLVFYRHYNPCTRLPICAVDTHFDRAHNFVFDYLVSFGVLGFLALMSIPIFLIFNLFKVYLKNDKLSFWEPAIIFITLTTYFVQALTVFGTPGSYMMFVLIIGFGTFLLIEDKKIDQKEKEINYFLIGAIVLIFFFTFINFVINPIKSSKYIVHARFIAPHGSNEKIETYKKALELSPLGKYETRILLASDLKSIIQTNDFEEALTDPSFRDIFFQSFDFAIVELKKSTEQSPYDYFTYLKLGELYTSYYIARVIEAQLKGDFLAETQNKEMTELLVLAEKYLKRAIEISPTEQQGYWSLSQTKFYQRDFEGAFNLAIQSIDLEPRLLDSHLLAFRIADRLFNDPEKVKGVVERALLINPKWEIHFEDYIEIENE